MSKRNARDLYNLAAENEGQSCFDLTDKIPASAQHTDRLSYSPVRYENERKFEKTEEN